MTCISSPCAIVHAALEAVSSAVEELAGVAAKLGKTRIYNRAGGAAPPSMSELGREAWRGRCPSVGLLPSARPSARSWLPCARGRGAGPPARLAGGAAAAA